MVPFWDNLICRGRASFLLQFTKSYVRRVCSQGRHMVIFLSSWDLDNRWWSFRLLGMLVVGFLVCGGGGAGVAVAVV